MQMSVDGNILTIKVDLSKEFGISKSGKSISIASSRGAVTVPGRTEKVNLNIYRSH
jgi:hypothetical protein